MALTNFVATPYAGLLSALASNFATTELATSNGYPGREAVTLSFDSVSNQIALTEGFTFGPATGAWTAAVDVGVFDASTVGNLLLVWGMTSFTGASGLSLSQDQMVIQAVPGVFVAGQVIPVGTVVGTLPNGNPVKAGVDLAFNGSTISANAASGLEVVLTDAATVATDVSKGKIFSVTVAGNRTFGAPTNMRPGDIVRWYIKQDAVGSRVLTLNGAFTTAGGAPTFTTTANATDRLTAQWCATAGKWRATVDLAFA